MITTKARWSGNTGTSAQPLKKMNNGLDTCTFHMETIDTAVILPSHLYQHEPGPRIDDDRQTQRRGEVRCTTRNPSENIAINPSFANHFILSLSTIGIGSTIINISVMRIFTVAK